MVEFSLKPVPLVESKIEKIGGLTLKVLNNKSLTALLYGPKSEARYRVQPGEVKSTNAGKLVWFARNQALLFGTLEEAKDITCVDITDGWVFFSLKGNGAEQVLARFSPVDLRPSHAEPDQSFRTLFGDMPTIIVTVKSGYEIGVPSSMARTARYDILEAMKSVHSLSS